MRKLVNEVSYSALLGLIRIRKVILKYIVNTRGGYLITGLIIGMSSIIILHELSSHNYFSIKKVVYQAEVSPQADTLVEAKAKTGVLEKEIKKVEHTSDIKSLITSYFGSDSVVAHAVFKTESGLNPTAMNWNCRYNGISKQCKPEDRGQAWSVDCGIAQINVVGKDCPKELFNPEENLKRAKEMFDKRGFQPWIAFNMGYHLANLK